MINNTTLNELNDTEFGADLDKIELYVLYYIKAASVSDMRKYNKLYNKCRKLLKDLKETSVVFQNNNSFADTIEDKYDIDTSNIIDNNIEITSKVNNTLLNNILSSETGNLNIVGIPYIDGINVKCIYINGYIYRIYICDNYNNYMNVTDNLKHRIPNHIEELSNHPKTILIGKLTIFNTNIDIQSFLNDINTSIMMYIINNIHTDKIELIFTDIFDENIKTYTHWDRLEYMRTLHINVPHHAMLRNIDATLIAPALESFNEYFEDIVNTTGIIYSYSGIELRVNEDTDYSIYDRIIYSKTNNENKVYESKIKSFSTIDIDNKIFINAHIIRTDCDGCNIENVIIPDICVIDKYNLKVGESISFEIINNKAYIK